LSVARPFGVPIFPVVHCCVFLTISFQHFIVVGILGILTSFAVLLLGISSKGILDFQVGELFDRHRWQNMAGLEDLSLVLLQEVYAIVNII
jgi:hypothetical protein